MDPLQALILGIAQGATEFLPISSSAHLVFVPWLLGWPAPGLAFDTFLHLGTLFAVMFYFRAELVWLLRGWLISLRLRNWDAHPAGRTAWLILLGTLPAAILGFTLEDFFAALFDTPLIVGGLLMGTGVLLYLGERTAQARRDWMQLGVGDALWIGLAQGLALAPGISRSGATISAGLWRGLTREAAARFSFLLGVPAILGAGLLKLWELLGSNPLEEAQLTALTLGFLGAAAVGYGSIDFLLAFLRRHSLRYFIVYCWLVGGGVVLVAVLRA